MKSLYSFIIKPLKERYNNEKQVGDKSLILNTTINNHRFVSKEAVVVSVPAAYSSQIKQNDIVQVHHNLFRRWHDQKGVERNSSTYFKDDLYFASPEQIYMYTTTYSEDGMIRKVDNVIVLCFLKMIYTFVV